MSDNTFTRHMGIFATATDLQTAVAEGKLGDPYVARILLDSSVTGYESSGIYIQESESGSPDMTVIDYVEPDSSSGGQATHIPDNFTRVNLESGNAYASFGDFPAETLLKAIDDCCDDSSTYGLYIMDASGNLTAFNSYYREVDHYKGMTMSASVYWMPFDGDLPIPESSPDKLFAEEARYQSTFINTIGKVPVLLYHNSSTGNDEALYDSSTAGLDIAQMAAGLSTGITRNEQEEPVNTGFVAEAAMWYDFEVNSSTGEVSITPHLAIGDNNQVNGGYNQYYTSSQFRLFAVPYADYIAAFNTNGYFYWKIQDNGGYNVWDVLEWAAGYANGYPNGYEPLATIADGSTFTFTPANEGFTVDSSMFIIGGTYNPEYPASQYYQGFYVNGNSFSTMRVTPVFTVPAAAEQNWWEDVDWNQDGVVFRGQNTSVRETLESFNDEGYETDLLGEDVVILINPTFANGQLSGGRAVHALQDEENENGRYFVNVNLQAGVPCYIVCMNAGNYVLSAVCEEEYDLDGISYSVEYDEYEGTHTVVIGECYGPNTPVPDSSADWYQLHFADNYNDTFYDYSEERFIDISELAGFIDSVVYGYMFDTSTASVALVIDGSFNDGYVSGGTCVPGTFTADANNSGTFRFENCQISDSSTVMLLIDAYGEYELSYDPSINVRWCNLVVGAAPFGYNITNGVEWSVTLEINSDTGDTTIIVGEITDIGDESGDSSTYTFEVGQDNYGYFDTDYYPGADTVVKFKGTIVGDGGITHGICGNINESNEWTYRMFGYEGAVYFDRETSDGYYRVNAEIDLSSSHEYEFGNFYIKVDDVEVASSEASLSDYQMPGSPIYIFAGSAWSENEGTHAWGYAGATTQLEWFQIYEPDGNGDLTMVAEYIPTVDASGNICLHETVNEDVLYPVDTDGSVNIIATLIDDSSQGGDSSIDASFAADGSAYITDYFMVPNGTEIDGWTAEGDAYFPSITYGTTDASANYFQIGCYMVSDYEDCEENDPDFDSEQYFIECLGIYAPCHVNGQTMCTYDASTTINTDGFYIVDDGESSYVFIGRFVNYVDELVQEGNYVYQRQEVVDAGPIIELGRWPDTPDSSSNPAVEVDNYYDDGAGTITFDAYLNGDAISAGAHHYSIGVTSDAMMQTAMENAMMNSEEFDPDAWMIAQCNGTYTGDSAAPNSITLSYSTSFDDQGQIIAVMYDSGDNIVQNYNGVDYTVIDGWQYSVPPEEFPPEEPPQEEPPIE